jgi:hypothetical protein
MNEQEREHSQLAKLSGYRVNATWMLFERFVIDGKPPAEALRLASDAMNVWLPWFEENHIEPPEPPDMPTQVAQAAQNVTDAIKKTVEDREAKRPLRRFLAWLRPKPTSAADKRTSDPNQQPASIQFQKEKP